MKCALTGRSVGAPIGCLVGSSTNTVPSTLMVQTRFHHGGHNTHTHAESRSTNEPGVS
jgi:hypothetical protein